jgi:hypothetical protein
MGGIEAEFAINAVENLTFDRIGCDEQASELESIVWNATVARDGIEGEIKSGLEPGCDSVGPFGDSVERFIGNYGARELRGHVSARRKVIV